MNSFVKNNENSIFKSSTMLSNQLIYWMNLEGKIVFANDCSVETLGYTEEEIKNLSVWDIDTIVKDKKEFDNALVSLEEDINNGTLMESFHIRKDGSTFPVEVVSKFKVIDGKEYIVSYARDITNRTKRIEEMNFYFRLINSSNDMILLVEHGSGVIEFANETTCKVLGYSLEELKTKNIQDFREPLDSLDNLELPEVFKKLQEQKEMITFGVYTTKDGRKIPVESSLQINNYHDKNYVIAISRDISDRLNIEKHKEELNKKLKNYNKTLKKEIAQSKQELIEYENIMKRQSKMAAMGEMIENIAHQWRQPLSAVSVLASGMKIQNEHNLLKKEILDSGLNDINEQAQYLSKTIDDFRNFFKPNKQKNHFELEHIIYTTKKLSRAKYDKKDIEYIMNVEDIKLYTFENELLQVLLNIISNAKEELVKKEHSKYVFINATQDDKHVLISIRDNAGGIDKYIINRVFEPYFTTKHKYHGTGIGLYMSEKIITKHMHGTIDVKNVDFEHDGKAYTGAQFDIKLPL